MIQQTSSTPMVISSPEDGIISIKGKITPESPVEFFRQLDNATSEVLKKKTTENLVVNFQLEYFNTPSARMLALYFKSILPENPRITWNYQKGDDTLREAGEEYSELLDFPFDIVPV